MRFTYIPGHMHISTYGARHLPRQLLLPQPPTEAPQVLMRHTNPRRTGASAHLHLDLCTRVMPTQTHRHTDTDTHTHTHMIQDTHSVPTCASQPRASACRTHTWRGSALTQATLCRDRQPRSSRAEWNVSRSWGATPAGGSAHGENVAKVSPEALSRRAHPTFDLALEHVKGAPRVQGGWAQQRQQERVGRLRGAACEGMTSTRFRGFGAPQCEAHTPPHAGSVPKFAACHAAVLASL